LWEWTEFGKKSGWNWLELLSALAIPVVLAIFGFWFTAQQDARQQKIENQRAKQAQNFEDQRAEAERKLAEQRAQDEALQAYLDQMNNLLLEHNLRDSEEYSDVRTLARARTLTVLARLGPSRQGEVMQFLAEADLLRQPTIWLNNADLSGANLSGIDLSEADLSRANLSGANLCGTILYKANLVRADLTQAKICGTTLHEADLSEADLSWRSGLDYLKSLNRGGREAWQEWLEAGVDLSGADLYGTKLNGANLCGARWLTDEQIAAAESLHGATMPNGQKYEDWLKDRENHGGG
jgi:uncharacterized protein YjbI with pentapeptide repeats